MKNKNELKIGCHKLIKRNDGTIGIGEMTLIEKIRKLMVEWEKAFTLDEITNGSIKFASIIPEIIQTIESQEKRIQELEKELSK